MYTNRRLALALSLLALAASAALAQHKPARPGSGPFQHTQTFNVGGEGGWDYITIDPQSQRLYVPRSTHTMVIDAKTGKSIADIPGQKRNHGVVIASEANRGFITDGQDGTVTVF